MKKRLLAMLLALMLVVGLLPVGVLAAGDGAEEYITTTFSDDSGKRDVTVNVIGPNNENFGTHTYHDVSGGANTITLMLTNDGYEIAYVDNNSVWNKPHSITSVSKTSDSYSFVFSSGYDLVLTVYLIKNTGDPSVSGEINRLTVSYRIYDDQVLKMLYSKNVDVDENTEIVSIKPTWTKEFGSESNKGFTGINREEDYAHLVVTSDSADREEVQPKNISYITITYIKNGDMEDSVQIPASELKFTREEEALSPYYNITLNNDEFHVVYFYNEEGSNIGNNYALYAVRFVNHGESLGDDMPADPKYPNTTYQFVAWTDGYDGGKPFIETTPVTEDTVVYAQKTLSTKASEIHVMNDGNLFKDRIQELYGRNDINWDSVKVSVYAEDGSYTNPDYSISPNANGWRDNYYFVYNYLSGVGEQENDPIFINDITHIVVTANAADGSELGPITINKGIYDGDFSVSTGAQGSSYIIELYINDNGVEDPGEEPGPEPVAKLDVDKTVAIPDGEGTAAVGDVLEYTVTITNLNSVAATGVKVTDTMWSNGGSVIINGTSYSVDSGSVTVDVPANGSVDIYYTYTVPETDAGKTVENTVTVGDMTITTSTAVDEAEEPEEPGKPSEPTEDELNQLYVVLDCINADAQHADKRFHLDQDNSYVTVDLTTGICTVQPNYDFILATYNEQVADGHTYADDAEKTLMLTWDGTNKTWIVAGDVASITRQVMCPPKAPTADEVNELIDVYVDCITPGTSHDWTFVDLDEAGYKVGTDELKDGQYYCNVTFDAKYFVDEFGTKDGRGPHITNDVDATVTFVYDNGWKLADGETSQVKFTAECEPIVYTIHVSFVGPNGEAYGGGDVISTAPNDSVAIADEEARWP